MRGTAKIEDFGSTPGKLGASLGSPSFPPFRSLRSLNGEQRAQNGAPQGGFGEIYWALDGAQ